MANKIIQGLVYVLGDKIDTDQIIRADYLNNNPAIPEERLLLGSRALDNLPPEIMARQPFMTEEQREAVAKGLDKVVYRIIIGGKAFGCGSSREHAPVCLGAAGIKAVVAEGYAKIFFKNSVTTGEIFPAESKVRLVNEFATGEEARLDLDNLVVFNLTRGTQFELKRPPLDYIFPMVEAGGLFNYGREEGIVPPKVE